MKNAKNAMFHGSDSLHAEAIEIALKLDELERAHDDEELFPDGFMREFTEFPTWDAFKRLLAATPRGERAGFVARTTRFSCYEEMEGMALERLIARKFARCGARAVPLHRVA